MEIFMNSFCEQSWLVATSFSVLKIFDNLIVEFLSQVTDDPKNAGPWTRQRIQKNKPKKWIFWFVELWADPQPIDTSISKSKVLTSHPLVWTIYVSVHATLKIAFTWRRYRCIWAHAFDSVTWASCVRSLHACANATRPGNVMRGVIRCNTPRVPNYQVYLARAVSQMSDRDTHR